MHVKMLKIVQQYKNVPFLYPPLILRKQDKNSREKGSVSKFECIFMVDEGAFFPRLFFQSIIH